MPLKEKTKLKEHLWRASKVNRSQSHRLTDLKFLVLVGNNDGPSFEALERRHLPSLIHFVSAQRMVKELRTRLLGWLVGWSGINVADSFRFCLQSHKSVAGQGGHLTSLILFTSDIKGQARRDSITRVLIAREKIYTQSI